MNTADKTAEAKAGSELYLCLLFLSHIELKIFQGRRIKMPAIVSGYCI